MKIVLLDKLTPTVTFSSLIKLSQYKEKNFIHVASCFILIEPLICKDSWFLFFPFVHLFTIDSSDIYKKKKYKINTTSTDNVFFYVVGQFSKPAVNIFKLYTRKLVPQETLSMYNPGL